MTSRPARWLTFRSHSPSPRSGVHTMTSLNPLFAVRVRRARPGPLPGRRRRSRAPAATPWSRTPRWPRAAPSARTSRPTSQALRREPQPPRLPTVVQMQPTPATRAAPTHREGPPSLRQNRGHADLCRPRRADAPASPSTTCCPTTAPASRAWTNDPDGLIDGPTVVLCNGLGTSAWAWPALLEPDCGVRVVSWNHRGTGGSDRPADPAPRRDRGVRRGRALGDGPLRRRPGAVLMGWSMGVNTMFELAVRHPERVSGPVRRGGGAR